MQRLQLEGWVLDILDRVRKHGPVEASDDRVELKAKWPEDPTRTARRLAAHANAARGEAIMWVIGIDEKTGTVLRAAEAELAEWWSQVESRFDGFAPRLAMHIPVKDGEAVAVALLFETVAPPYLVRTGGGGPVTHEVPWREGTKVRTAKRADLVRILAPLQRTPLFEFLGGSLEVRRHGPDEPPSFRDTTASSPYLRWSLDLSLYVVPQEDGLTVIPYHQCYVALEAGSLRLEMESPTLNPPVRFAYSRDLSQMFQRDSLTIEATSAEALIQAPGRIELHATRKTQLLDRLLTGDIKVVAKLRPVGVQLPAVVSVTLPHVKGERGEWGKWEAEPQA